MVKTQAYVVEHPKGEFSLQDVELDDPAADEVLVEMKTSGICQTDIGARENHYDMQFPLIAGHESAGIVKQVGKNVHNVKVGDTVCCSFSFCGECRDCKRGRTSTCSKWVPLNFGQQRMAETSDHSVGKDGQGRSVRASFFGQSGFARHAIMHKTSLVVVPASTPINLACTLGCGFQTGAGAVLRVLKPDKQTSLAVFGLGAVGFGALFAAASEGVKEIIAVDVVPKRLELAKELGATVVINAAKEDVVARLKELTDGAGIDYAVEATGVSVSIKSAFSGLSNGGHMIQLGSPGWGHTPHIEIHEAVAMSKTYQGVCEGQSHPPEFLPQLLDLMAKGKFPIEKISKEYKFAEMDQALKEMKTGEVIKPILIFD